MTETDLFIQLLEFAQSGDQASLERLATLAKGKLWAFYRRLALKDDLIEDLVQDATLEMIKSLSTLRNANRFWPWLYRIAHSKVSDHFRGLHRRRQVGSSPDQDRPVMDPAEALLPEPVEQVGRTELVHVVRAAMAELKIAHRTILVLRVFEQMPYAEIAAVTGNTELNIRALFFRAKSALRKQLSLRGINKGMFFSALVVFGKATSPSEAAFGEIALAASSLKVGFTGSFIGGLGTQLGVTTLIILGAICLATLCALSASPAPPVALVDPPPLAQSPAAAQNPRPQTDKSAPS